MTKIWGRLPLELQLRGANDFASTTIRDLNKTLTSITDECVRASESQKGAKEFPPFPKYKARPTLLWCSCLLRTEKE